MNLVIADTCIWINALKDVHSEEAQNLSYLIDTESLVITGVVITELLQGIKDNTTFNLLIEKLQPFPFIETSRHTWIEAGRLGAKLLKSGKHLPLSDLLMAAICLENDIFIYTDDNHFFNIPSLKIYSVKNRLT